ncbi:unnamed protein product [Dracunculus medinensis]|uniref:Endo/exonuclease/phosphatase domain-containing protein n=1 Tax=Dracunculus medinensis TaxID=318479 RepID=A0A0N4UQW6_DRAME|nr:unnamed protein product [Dracunculus medinensis]
MGTALCTRGEVLAISAWNVRTLIEVASQAITVNTLSKYRVDIVCLSEVRLPYFGSRLVINPGLEHRDTGYIAVVLLMTRGDMALPIVNENFCFSFIQ